MNNSLAITGNVTFASTGGGSLTFDPTGLATPSTVTIGNTPILTVNNATTIKEAIGGTGFTLAGTGTLTLSGANTYGGGTTIASGTLRVTNTAGSATGTGLVTVGDMTNPATLAGSTAAGQGAIAGAVTVNNAATIAAGSGASLTIGGGLTLDGGSLSRFALTTDGADNSTPLVNVTDGGLFGPTSGTHTVGITGSVALGTYDLIGFAGTAPAIDGFTLGNTLGSGFNEYLQMADDQLDLIVAVPTNSAVWNTAGDGAYGDGTKWDPMNPPGGAGRSATFGGGSTNPIDASTVGGNAIGVSIDGAYRIGSLVFDNATVSYTLATNSVAGHGLTLDNGGAANGSFTGAVVAVNSGSHAISANLRLADSAGTTFDIADGSSLAVSGVMSGSGANQSLTLTGGGTLTLSNTNSYSGGTIVAAGTLRTTANGALGGGPVAVRSAGTDTPLVDVGGNESVGGLSGSVAGSGSATVKVEAGKSLTIAPAAGTSTFAGTLNLVAGTTAPGTGGTLAKSGVGTEALTGAVQLGDGAALDVSGGTLQVNASGGTIGSGVTANVTGAGTLELAGPYSALGNATLANRAAIGNNSAAAVGLLVSSGNQIVGGIDGAGSVQVAPPTGQTASLTADYITAGSLMIGGDATSSAIVNIAASDASGNPTASGGFALAGSLRRRLAQRQQRECIEPPRGRLGVERRSEPESFGLGERRCRQQPRQQRRGRAGAFDAATHVAGKHSLPVGVVVEKCVG